MQNEVQKILKIVNKLKEANPKPPPPPPPQNVNRSSSCIEGCRWAAPGITEGPGAESACRNRVPQRGTRVYPPAGRLSGAGLPSSDRPVDKDELQRRSCAPEGVC